MRPVVLLDRKGEVPSDVERAIQAKTDAGVLTEWLLLAADVNVKTVGEFQEQMGSIPGEIKPGCYGPTLTRGSIWDCSTLLGYPGQWWLRLPG